MPDFSLIVWFPSSVMKQCSRWSTKQPHYVKSNRTHHA